MENLWKSCEAIKNFPQTEGRGSFQSKGIGMWTKRKSSLLKTFQKTPKKCEFWVFYMEKSKNRCGKKRGKLQKFDEERKNRFFGKKEPMEEKISTNPQQETGSFSTEKPRLWNWEKPCDKRGFRVFHSFRRHYYYDYDKIYLFFLFIFLVIRAALPEPVLFVPFVSKRKTP